MDFALNEEQTAIFDMAYAFGQDAIAPHARDWEAAGTIPKELWPQVGALGFGGLYVSEAGGGSGLSRLDATLVFEALSMACPSVAAFLSIHNMCAKMLDTFASDEMKARVMPDVLTLNKVLSLLPDRTGVRLGCGRVENPCAAHQRGLHRSTAPRPSFPAAAIRMPMSCMVRTGDDGPSGVSTLLVDDGAPGLSFGALEDKMGWRSQPTAPSAV